MTPAQIALARHALGLPNDRKMSYRNRFVTGPKSPDFPLWKEMQDDGNARDLGSVSKGNRLFYLTPAGAEAALLPGETLDREDFPNG